MINEYVIDKPQNVGIQMRILMKDDEPVSLPAHRLSFSEREIVDKQIKEWLAKGVIRPSLLEYATPIVLVKKKNGTYRLCVD